jgi:hypothetical protein
VIVTGLRCQRVSTPWATVTGGVVSLGDGESDGDGESGGESDGDGESPGVKALGRPEAPDGLLAQTAVWATADAAVADAPAAGGSTGCADVSSAIVHAATQTMPATTTPTIKVVARTTPVFLPA